MPTGGQALVAALEELGVQVAFGLPGVHNLAAWMAFPGSPVRLVGVRHEQTAGYAADGYARATGRLGVAITTTGPGASNVVTAVGEAWACHSPMVVIATDIPTTVRRAGAYRGVLHETTDQASFFRPVTKAQLRVPDVGALRSMVVMAGLTAMTHPRGPVYVEVPTDLLSASYDGEQPSWTVEVPAGAVEVPAGAVEVSTALAALGASRRPLLWAGGGATASGAGPGLAALARALGAPVLTSYGGRGLLAPDDPHLVPLPPQCPEAGALWDAADLVLVLGSDLDAMNTQGFRQPRPPVVVTVDLTEPVNVEPDVWLCADVDRAVQALLAGLPATPRELWWPRPPGREAYAGPETAFLDALESGLGEDAVVVADMCVAGYWYGGFGRVRSPRGLAYPVGWGTLGFGFPAGLGAALSGRPTVAVVGDGGFLFACGDLATAAQERLPLTTVLVDDGGYGMLAYDFTRNGETPVGCDLEPPDFVALAAAFRVAAREVTVEELGAAVAAGVAGRQPGLLVVKAAFTPPPTSSPRWYRAGG